MVVGITGGIGSGKSTLAAILRVLGYPVYNSDLRSRDIVNANGQVMWQIKEVFGEKIYKNDVLDRKLLADIVFNDASKLQILNGIIHPAVADDFIAWKRSQKHDLMFKEAAILFESGAYRMMDKVVSVTAPEALRIKRVMRRDRVSIDIVKSRMANQWSDSEREKLTDYIIYADDKQLLIPQVLELINKLKKTVEWEDQVG